jgi:hypothetical protein
MTSTELIRPSRAPSPPERWSDARHDAHPAASADPTVREMLDETLPLVGAVPVYGPPVVVVAAPWLLLVLMLAGPFALLVTFVVLLAAATVLVSLIGAILAVPYVLVRHLRGHWAGHASMPAAAAKLVPGESRWGAA